MYHLPVPLPDKSDTESWICIAETMRFVTLLLGKNTKLLCQLCISYPWDNLVSLQAVLQWLPNLLLDLAFVKADSDGNFKITQTRLFWLSGGLIKTYPAISWLQTTIIQEADSAAGVDVIWRPAVSIGQVPRAFSNQENDWLSRGGNKGETFISCVAGRKSNTTLTHS